jgi:hypothetical protein
VKVKNRISTKLEQRIADELYLAAARLGADPLDVRLIPLNGLYDVLEELGADRYLLALAATWGDGNPWTETDDAETLKLLHAWAAVEHEANALH